MVENLRLTVHSAARIGYIENMSATENGQQPPSTTRSPDARVVQTYTHTAAALTITVDSPATATAKLTTIQPGGFEVVELRDPTNRPTLPELQARLGGTIKPVDAFMDGEEAYAMHTTARLLPNMHATRRINWPDGWISGPVIIMEGFRAG